MTNYDDRIPEKLQYLRLMLEGKDDLAIFAYYPSLDQTNYANPSFCLGAAEDEPETMDITGTIEETLHALLHYGGTGEDIRDILGLVPYDELDEETLEYEEYTPIDLGWCIEGQLLDFEKIAAENSDVHDILTDIQIDNIEVLAGNDSLIKATEIAHNPTISYTRPSLDDITHESRESSDQLSATPNEATHYQER